MGVIGMVAGSIGADEAALRLMLSLMFGYPVALAHRKFLRNQSQALQHIFFIFSGLGMGYFNFGVQALHFVACTAVLYITLLVAGGTVGSVVFSFIFQMGYLIVGYVFSQTDGYDVNWSTPHCVLTLKLIGVAFDMFDGHKDKAGGWNEWIQNVVGNICNSECMTLVVEFGYVPGNQLLEHLDLCCCML